ncbi:bifunctional diaminohydroxyphosphoribosylaminopyrimidine deaminase/5-amino-6-(5-phosphoribosylamino)uracil reductase RibD [Frigidibacter oleivorans]|uniref:bifunctional diaminohydroxyphosphoribosylaminopyrimidine deaminase/5-amino-6-(5-phosphoribosylamino)uracil reductase RibD n=1 Tax=Frigidibacter oleivorans TaxID=2487129 RepID=UPI0022A7F16A|nr:bifunctional diaminohydroxyphosphoribosylaminopyrimidine deaminase/5-amino-6-(5-phosphoribosylamino)uracil reductase RibD [Frigidibacter oleivorans]
MSLSPAEADRRFMALAIALGRRGLGRVWPNPAVGCVVVADGRILGRGWTADGGRPHAEPQALAQAGAAARGATAYVSLEPCAHHGQTPPCAGALVAAGVARVVTALEDPDPRVAGRGHDILRAAGVAVTTGVLSAEAEAAQRGFLTRIRQGRPMVTLKLATSFDGRIATATGESRWITGPEARHLVHGMRARHDAVLVGAGTARADDPLLTVRGLGSQRQPVRIVAAARLDLPRGRLLASLDQGPVWLLHGRAAPEAARAAWQQAGATLIEVPEGASDGLDPAAMLAALGARGLTRVFCEGGGRLAASLLQRGLVDEVTGFTAGLALGAAGRAALGPLDHPALADAPRFRLIETRVVGGDVLHHWVRDR